MLATALAAALSTSTATAVPKPVASGAPWTVAERAVLARDLDGLLSRAATVQGAHAGLLAVETATGHVLYARDAGDAFTPASSFKVLTGSAALATLGPDFTFETSVGAASSAAGTRLVLVGGGDALLRASDLEQAAAAVAGAGITSVAGVDADASYYDAEGYEPGWSWDDFPYYYAPLVSALCLEDNVVHATLTPGAAAGDRPGLALQPAATLAIENHATTGAPRSPDTVDVAREDATIVFTGSIPQDRVPEHLDAAVPDPNRYALEVFSDALVRHGVHIDDAASDTIIQQPHPRAADYRPLWRHSSAPLAQYLRDFWFPSDNLVGEMLIKALGVARSGVPGTAEHGAALERDWLRGIGVDPARLRIADGSGLSVYDRITPRALVRILQYDWNSPNRDVVLDALPVAGVRGSMRNDFKGTPAERRVFAKTGTVSYARALAGYLRPRRHGAVTFAFMLDDWLGEQPGIDSVRTAVLSRMITD